jgi:hypothetical protein
MRKPWCLPKVHRNESLTYYHPILGAALLHPDVRELIPLRPEPLVKPDGTAKNACERNAAKRFIAKLHRDHIHLQCIITGMHLRWDSLSSLLYSEELNSITISAPLQATDRRHEIVDQKSSDFQLAL